MRLSPIVPFNLQNYALGVTAIPFLQYFIATLIGIVPGIAIYHIPSLVDLVIGRTSLVALSLRSSEDGGFG